MIEENEPQTSSMGGWRMSIILVKSHLSPPGKNDIILPHKEIQWKIPEIMASENHSFIKISAR